MSYYYFPRSTDSPDNPAPEDASSSANTGYGVTAQTTTYDTPYGVKDSRSLTSSSGSRAYGSSSSGSRAYASSSVQGSTGPISYREPEKA
jgi:hypothetical protein